MYDKQPSGTAHLIMTRLPGTPLSSALPTMSPAQIASTARDLADYLSQLRRLPPPLSASGTPLIGGASPGSPGLDHRLGPRPWGPFTTVADFHTYVRFGEPLDQWEHEPAVVEIHGKPEGTYRVVFSHADLAPNNILVDPSQGKITGIVDWEFGGWYPEYWEYTKMFYGGVRPGWDRWFEAVEGEGGIEKYEGERRAEEVIWMRAGPFGYV
jgi:thiamine kinase-like enzyme